MQVVNFQLTHFGRFEFVNIDLARTLDGNVTVLIGNNGAGKTTLLKGLATGLSWLVARIRSENGRGGAITDGEILNGRAFAEIQISATDERWELVDDRPYRWTLNQPRKGRMRQRSSDLQGVTHSADFYRHELTKDESASLPLIAYYPVERVVLDIPLKIKTRHSFGQLEGYDNALQQGIDFRRFFEWFRDREDAENETSVPENVIAQIAESLDSGALERFWKDLARLGLNQRDKQLMAVRTAIADFMPGFKNLRVKRKPRLSMVVDKDGQVLDVGQLSQGEKSLMALIGDLARRLAMMNPALENPLHGEGIVIIDEIDLHLHPTWQRSIVGQLQTTFPNCQFILTTHSPAVISDSKRLICYSLDNGEIRRLDPLYGMDVNQVLLKEMDAPIRNEQVTHEIGELLDNIQDGNLATARTMLAKLERELPFDHWELNKARLLIRKQELRNASHQ